MAQEIKMSAAGLKAMQEELEYLRSEEHTSELQSQR